MSGRSRKAQKQFKYNAKDIKKIIDNKWSKQWNKIWYKVDFNDEGRQSPDWITEWDVKPKDLSLKAWDDLILQMPASPYQHHQDLLETRETMQGRYLHAEIFFDIDDSLGYATRIRSDYVEGWYYFRGHPLKEMIDIPLQSYNTKKKTNFKLDDVCCICVHILHVLHHCFFVPSCEKKKSVMCLPILSHFCEQINKTCINTSRQIYKYLNKIFFIYRYNLLNLALRSEKQ